MSFFFLIPAATVFRETADPDEANQQLDFGRSYARKIMKDGMYEEGVYGFLRVVNKIDLHTETRDVGDECHTYNECHTYEVKLSFTTKSPLSKERKQAGQCIADMLLTLANSDPNVDLIGATAKFEVLEEQEETGNKYAITITGSTAKSYPLGINQSSAIPVDLELKSLDEQETADNFSTHTCILLHFLNDLRKEARLRAVMELRRAADESGVIHNNI